MFQNKFVLASIENILSLRSQKSINKRDEHLRAAKLL